jgi:hypothetical protein
MSCIMQFGGSLPKDDSLLHVSDFAHPRVIQALNPVRKKLPSNSSALAITLNWTLEQEWCRHGMPASYAKRRKRRD